jgi:ABC-type transport system substrate-binding protein
MGRREKTSLIVLLVLAAANGFMATRTVYLNATVAAPARGGEYREGIIGQPRFINPLLADTPVTADDVVFTIKTLQDPSFNSPLRGEWLSTTVDKIDSATVVFTVKDVSGPFFHNLTLPIISKAVWEQVSPENFLLSQANIEAMGSGPYLIREVRKLAQGTVQNMKLEAFTNYYAQRAYIDVIRLNFYNSTEEVLNAIHGKQIDGFGFTPFETNIRLDRSSPAFQTQQVALPE